MQTSSKAKAQNQISSYTKINSQEGLKNEKELIKNEKIINGISNWPFNSDSVNRM